LPGSGGNQEEGHIKRVAFYSHFVWQFGSRQWGSCVLHCVPHARPLILDSFQIATCSIKNKTKAKGGNNVRWSDMNDMKGIGDI